MNRLTPLSLGVRGSFSALLLVLLFAVRASAQFHGGAIFNDPFGPDGTTRVKVGDWVTNRIVLLNFDECNDSLNVTNLTFTVSHFSGVATYITNFTTPQILRQSIGGCPSESYFETSFRWRVLPGDENLPGGVLLQDVQWNGKDLRNALPFVDCTGAFLAPSPCGPAVADDFSLSFPAQVTVERGTTTNLCVLEAVSDKWNPGGSSHAVWLPGIYTDFIFTPTVGTWSAGGDTATLTGTIRRRDDWGSGFEITVNLAGKTTATNAAQPPHFDLEPGAYIWNGGPVDPRTWCYYEQFSGVFTGFGQYQGAVLDIARRGPAWQMGVGANNKNANYGASAWFTWTLRSPFGSLPLSGVGDFNVDITDCTPPTLCVKQAVSDKWNNGGTKHAVWMPGIYEKFIFNPQFGSWTASNDVATLRGVIRREDDLTSGFNIVVNLSRKTNSPDSEPHLSLDPSAYIWNGGPVDPSTWVYYEEFEGDFTGFGRYQGAVLHITRYGPAWQMGVGANNKNGNYGAASWFTWAQTTQFGSLPASGVGDFNIDIFQCYPATLGDFVWLDGNANGQQDTDEPGLPEINVQLLGCSSTVVLLSANTDSLGKYSFTGLMAGSYRIKVGLRDGLLVTPAQNVGNDASDSDVSPTSLMSACVSLTNSLSASTNLTVDVGLVPPAGPSPAPRLLDVQGNAQGQTVLSVQGPRYRKYAIEMTDTFGKGWEPGGTVWNLDGKLRFSEPARLPSCLYRVKLLP